MPEAEEFKAAVIRHIEESEDLMRARNTLFLLLLSSSGAALGTIASEGMLLADCLGRLEIAKTTRSLALAEASWTSLPPKEAIAFFKRKMVMTQSEAEEYRALEDAYMAKGFSVAGLDERWLLERMHYSISEAIDRGTTKNDFVKAMKNLPTGLEKDRLGLVFDTNVLGAYAAGRYAQMTAPDTLEARPYWQYRTAGDHRVRPTHQAMDRKTFPASSSVWDDWYPPNGYRCRCTVYTLSKEEVEREKLEVKPSLPHALEVDGKVVQMVPDPGFGGSPRVQARADAVASSLRERADSLGMLRPPRLAETGTDHIFSDEGDLVRERDSERNAKIDRLTGLSSEQAERLAKETPFFNLFPRGELGEVPPGETWVEVVIYSQNVDTTEQIARRLANQRGMGHLSERLRVSGRASYGDYDPIAWPDIEVAHDGDAARRLGLPTGHVFSRSTEAVLRIVARTPEELSVASRIALQTGQGDAHPVRRAWDVPDIRIRGELPDRLEGFSGVVLNRRSKGSGEQVVLSSSPFGGWRQEKVLVNEKLALFL